MHVEFTDDAAAARDEMSDRAYDSMWDVLERILAEPENAPYASYASYSSAFDVWGTKVPGTDFTCFWKIAGDVLIVVWLLEDGGF